MRFGGESPRHAADSIEWVPCTVPGGDAHAGRTETSLVLHLFPSAVRIERAAPGNTRPLAELMPALMSDGVQSVSANGVLGDPAGASGTEGAGLLDAMVGSVLDRLAERTVQR